MAAEEYISHTAVGWIKKMAKYTSSKKKKKGGKRGSCWKGYHRVKGKKQWSKGSCSKN